MLSPAEALQLIRARAPRLPTREVAVGAGLAGEVLAEDVHAAVSLPPFPVSAMDGYAVRRSDLGNGTLPIAFSLAAGDPPRDLPAGTAAGIATGAPMPAGGDAVVPVENAREEEGRLVATAADAGDFVRPAGGDIEMGGLVGAAGARLTPARVAAVSAAGIARVRVGGRPRIAVLATGNELVRPGQPLEPGQIYESNMSAISALAARCGAEVVSAEIVPDSREETERRFAAALGTADVVVSSGGVSVGPHDHVKPAMAALGVEEVFWRIAHKPGKPLWFGVAPSGALVFGLPGNPVSSLVCFELFVREALDAMRGATPLARPVAPLAEPVRRIGRDHAVRCRLLPGPDGMRLHPHGAQDSHLIVHAANADAIALVERGEGDTPAGLLVEYLPL